MRIRVGAAAIVAMGAAGALPQDYRTPSFDCANTTTQQELRICRSSELSELDGRRGSLVERAIRASPDREGTRAEMDAWLERVRNPCQTDACLVDAYTAHIRELERIVPAVTRPPAITAPAFRPPPATPVQTVAASPGTPANPEVPKTRPTPDPGDDDEADDDEDGWRGYVLALAMAGLALVVWGVFRAARQPAVMPGGGRDASGDRP